MIDSMLSVMDCFMKMFCSIEILPNNVYIYDFYPSSKFNKRLKLMLNVAYNVITFRIFCIHHYNVQTRLNSDIENLLYYLISVLCNEKITENRLFRGYKMLCDEVKQ